MILEFFEDLYDADRKEFASFQVAGEGEEAVFTGDPIVDELERRLAAGEDLGTEDLEILERGVAVEEQLEGTEEADIEDDYSDLSAPPR